MSTIASPRESSIPAGRRLPHITTPVTSARPSIDSPHRPGLRSQSASPNRGPAPRRNRAALREYYNLKKEEQIAEDTRSESEFSINDSDVIESELDRGGFDGDAYVKRVLEEQTLEELLKTYNQVLTDIRALDAEKKALVYDNYSKLIAATETIRKMRSNMDPLNPMASTLDPAIAQIYERASAVKAELKNSMCDSERNMIQTSEAEKALMQRRKAAAEKARQVLEVPERIRKLVMAGKEEEAAELWEDTLRTLETWKASGKGGKDVQDCIDDGEAALKGEPPSEKSWVNIRGKG